jgi:hypothetical protein
MHKYLLQNSLTMKRGEINLESTPMPTPLPAGYSRLNYIECTGTQYIKTGVYPTPNFKWYLEIEWMQFNNVNSFGSEDWNNHGPIIRISADDRYGGNGVYVGLNINYGILANNQYGAYNVRDYQSMLGRKTFYIENGHQYLNGVEVLQATITGSSVCDVYFFSSNSNNRADYKCKKARFYYSWMKNGVTLVREFIPALRVSDSKPGLYDTVNDVFYTNQGTGEFNYA